MRTVKSWPVGLLWKYVGEDLQAESLVFKDLMHFTFFSLLLDWNFFYFDFNWWFLTCRISFFLLRRKSSLLPQFYNAAKTCSMQLCWATHRWSGLVVQIKSCKGKNFPLSEPEEDNCERPLCKPCYMQTRCQLAVKLSTEILLKAGFCFHFSEDKTGFDYRRPPSTKEMPELLSCRILISTSIPSFRHWQVFCCREPQQLSVPPLWGMLCYV